jgi:glycosyltransferase involved in cell wall biosynthesis
MYQPSEVHAIEAAVKGADVVLSWCVFNLNGWAYNYDGPIIDYVQNSDKFATDVAESNKKDKRIYRAACSESVRDIVFKDPKDVAVIYNAIDPGRVTPKKGRDAQRRVWGIGPEKKIILYMGRMVKEKHPTLILAALAKLPEDYIVIMVGEGYEEELIYRIAQEQFPGRVFIINPQYHIGDILAAADVMCLPADFEGHPLSLCEAWLAGLPTVYTDIPVNQEMHRIHGELGVMVPVLPGNEVLARAILEATAHTPESFARINLARHVAWNNFTLPTAAGIWEEYFDYVVMDHRRKRRLVPIHPVKPMEPQCQP